MNDCLCVLDSNCDLVCDFQAVPPGNLCKLHQLSVACPEPLIVLILWLPWTRRSLLCGHLRSILGIIFQEDHSQMFLLEVESHLPDYFSH